MRCCAYQSLDNKFLLLFARVSDETSARWRILPSNAPTNPAHKNKQRNCDCSRPEEYQPRTIPSQTTNHQRWNQGCMRFYNCWIRAQINVLRFNNEELSLLSQQRLHRWLWFNSFPMAINITSRKSWASKAELMAFAFSFLKSANAACATRRNLIERSRTIASRLMTFAYVWWFHVPALMAETEKMRKTRIKNWKLVIKNDFVDIKWAGRENLIATQRHQQH